jgi:hypothetical protein
VSWPSFTSPYKEVRCPDGKPRFILKDPAKAFSILAPDWAVRVGALIKFWDKISANLDADVAKHYESLVDGLDNNYADIRTHYLAAYAQFCTNPCDTDASARLEKANEEIRQREFKLRELEAKMEQLARLARQTNGAALTPTLPRDHEMLQTKDVRLGISAEDRRHGGQRDLLSGIRFERPDFPSVDLVKVEEGAKLITDAKEIVSSLSMDLRTGSPNKRNR